MHVRVLLAIAAAGFASSLGLTTHAEDRTANRPSSGELAFAYQPEGDGKQPAKSDAKADEPMPTGGK